MRMCTSMCVCACVWVRAITFVSFDRFSSDKAYSLGFGRYFEGHNLFLDFIDFCLFCNHKTILNFSVVLFCNMLQFALLNIINFY